VPFGDIISPRPSLQVRPLAAPSLQLQVTLEMVGSYVEQLAEAVGAATCQAHPEAELAASLRRVLEDGGRAGERWVGLLGGDGTVPIEVRQKQISRASQSAQPLLLPHGRVKITVVCYETFALQPGQPVEIARAGGHVQDMSTTCPRHVP